MGTQKKILISTHLRLVVMGSLNGFLYRKFLLFMSCFWSSASTLFLALFGLFIRVKGNDAIRENDSGYVELNQDSEVSCKEEKVQRGNNKNNERQEEEEEEEESPKLFFKFKYQTLREDSEFIELDSASLTNTGKYVYLAGKGLSQFLKEPDGVILRVREFNTDSEDEVIKEETSCDEVLLEKKFRDKQVGEESVSGEGKKYSIGEAEKTELESAHEEIGRLESEAFLDSSFKGKGKLCGNKDNVLVDEVVLREGEGDQLLSEREFIGYGSDSDLGSDASSHEFVGSLGASTSEAFLSDKDFEDALAEEELEFAGIDFGELSSGYEADDLDDEDSYISQVLKKIDSQMEKSADLGSEELLEQVFQGCNLSKLQVEGCDISDQKGDCGDTNIGNSKSERVTDWENEDSDDLESLWEQQDFMEQLKMDLRKVRATGLPTISEEEEYPKIIEDFKPLKLDEKLHHGGRMSELHKFYRSYKERMRKLDILNYQKRIAMGCFQSKDPLQSISRKKDSAPSLVSLLSSKFLLCRNKISASDPMMNIIRELQSEFETVYVGQMCLSWEILHWQYQKALELWDSDHYGMRQYNEVAGEFQQFQVLLQRFVENEPYEGPRVENYTNQRYLLRNLLQVPVIREDSSKEKKAWRKGKDDDVITSDQLVEIMEESIRIFWRFIRADKDTNHSCQICRRVTQVEPEDPNELELLTDVRTSLQKKEKRLKDILRKGNGIFRKFQKQQEENSDHVLCFFSQVDMKLVSRVLNMSKITADQLLWCRNKLSKINFVSRKIHVEPTFCLFPC